MCLRVLGVLLAIAPIAAAAVPTITSATPGVIDAGGPYFQVTITGTNFIPFSQVSLSGVPLETFYDSATQLRAAISPESRAMSGRFEITVTTGAGTSNAVPLLISPVIGRATPSTVLVGSPALTISVSGIGFLPRDVLILDISGRQTTLAATYVSSAQLTAAIPASTLATPAAAKLSVADPLDNATSAQIPFTIQTPPVITSAAPNPIDAGGPYFQLTVNGTGFDSSAAVSLGPNALVTTYVSASQLKAAVTPEIRALSGTFGLVVTLSGGIASIAWPFRISPVLSSVTPSSAPAGSSALAVTVQGIGFTRQNQIQFIAGGQAVRVVTTYLNSTSLTAILPAAMLTTPGVAALQVIDSAGADASGTISFPIRAAPLIASLSPNPMDAGGAGLIATLTGAGFAAGSLLRWDGIPLAAVITSETQLSFSLTPEMRALSGPFPLTLTDPAGGISAPYLVVISPVLFSIAPASAAVGSLPVPISATGAGFTRNSTLVFSGSPLSTTYISATTLTAVIPAASLATPGRAAVQVIDAGGAGHSLEQAFQITGTASRPAITSLTPSTIPAGSSALVLAISGENFASASVVQWNDRLLTTSFISSTRLTAAVPGTLLAAAGTAAITVINPDGVSSASSAFIVTSPASSSSIFAALNAFSSKPSAAPGSLISIYGKNLASRVTVNGVSAPILYAGEEQINAQVPFETRLGVATLIVPGAAPATLEVAAIAPGILTAPDTGYAIAQDTLGALLTEANPIAPGQYATLYLTGQGLLDHALGTGAAAPSDPLVRPLAAVQATIADQPAHISFAGLAPGLMGVLQVNVLIPEIPEGPQPVMITIGGVPANHATLPIARAPNSLIPGVILSLPC